MKPIVIVAGEESGDQHAATIIRKLKQSHPHLHWAGIGGQHMQAEGVTLLSDLARFGVTGLTEVFKHLIVIRRALLAIQKYLIEHQPDILILVDYPGFNLRLAKFTRKHCPGTRIIYYISPQIWAWKAKRIHTIRQCVDRMAVILPFEKTIYEHAGVPVDFVGHPLIHCLKQSYPSREELGLPVSLKLVALLPGSRHHEVQRHLPIMCAAADQLSKKYPNLHFVIPRAKTIDSQWLQSMLTTVSFRYSIIDQQAQAVVSNSDVVVVASGTASLECALLQKPMCIVYKASMLSYLIATRVIRVKYLGLCNLLANKMIVPELLQHDLTVEHLSDTIDRLLNDPTLRKSMINNLHAMSQTLVAQEANRSIEELIREEIERTLV